MRAKELESNERRETRYKVGGTWRERGRNTEIKSKLQKLPFKVKKFKKRNVGNTKDSDALPICDQKGLPLL